MHISQLQYEYALQKIEELLPLVQETTPATAPSAIELTIFSEVVIAYEKEHYPLSPPDPSGTGPQEYV